MISINIFTYKGDEKIINKAIKSCFLIFKDECKVSIIDDSTHLMSEEYIQEAKNQGASYRISTFWRNKNLNGEAACRGILDEIIKSANGEPGFSIKMDPDTLILKKRLFDTFKKRDDLKYMGTTRTDGFFSGVCYCIKNEILKDMKTMIQSINLHKERSPEDVTIGCLATLCSFPHNTIMLPVWDDIKKSGVICGWNYNCANCKSSYEGYFNLFDFCTFGNWFMTEGLTPEDRIIPMDGVLSFIPQTK